MHMVLEHEPDLGFQNGHAVGIVMKELVRRAIVAIRNERQVFEVTAKRGYSGEMDDVLTSADARAQGIYLKSIQECFPSFGVVGEEDSLLIEPREGFTAYFTIDPLDGTKAFVRRQSHGVGTMLALVQDGVVVAAYIGDINTREIYGFRPGSRSVYRISEFEIAEKLSGNTLGSFRDAYILLRDPRDAYSFVAAQCVDQFKSVIVEGGSIGIWLARLWKGEVAAALLPPSFETPWDLTPIFGISDTLGFAFMRPKADDSGWERYRPAILREKYQRTHDTLIIHKSALHLL